ISHLHCVIVRVLPFDPSPCAAFPLFLFDSSIPPLLLFFPTRRSSDLLLAAAVERDLLRADRVLGRLVGLAVGAAQEAEKLHLLRSEEHTSELQSRENLVCRLLLEKKNKNNMSPSIVKRDSFPHVDSIL